jgi:hydroxymethylpyrimidine pyrophosphatase-like HAD family hydrolase
MNEQDCKKLAELLFPDVDKTPDYYEEKYPYRKLPNKAEVTRLGPSPTGFIHLGNLYSALADERIAHKNGGVFYLRIEDTDAKRTVEGAVDLVINSLRYFDIEFDEGAGFPDSDPVNAYGPYYQTQRVDIYHTFAKELVLKGLAYPCFCTEEELEAVRLQQEADKVLTGYYGKYAVCRDLSLETIEENLKAGKPYVLRLRSQGSPENEITFTDSIKGEIKLPENIHDVVLLKKDGIPTYHFAHAIDDHFMRTTTVVRDDTVTYEAFIKGQAFASTEYTAHPEKYGATEHSLNYVKKTRILKDDIVSFILEHCHELDSIDIVVGDEELKKNIMDRIRKATDEVYMTSSISQLLEISYKDAGKKSGVKFLTEYLGLSRENVAAFGDADNDTDMIEYAGVGIAMENAAPHLKEIADHITLHHDKDGVAYAFRNILNIC